MLLGLAAQNIVIKFLEAFLKTYQFLAPMNLLHFDPDYQTSACKWQDAVPKTTSIADSDVSLEILENQTPFSYLLSISSCLCIVFIVAIAVVPETGQ